MDGQDNSISMHYRRFHGRRSIFTDETEITEDNVMKVLEDTASAHALNEGEISYLFDYYNGIQPVLFKTKEVRPEINNIIVENHAKEFVDFKTGYLLNQNIEYVSKGGVNADGITELNTYMDFCSKSSIDHQIVQDMHICGIAFRGMFPRGMGKGGYALERGESPFEVFALSPKNTYVVRTTALGNRVVMAVTVTKRNDGKNEYMCFTPDYIFTMEGLGSQPRVERNPIGIIPIVEYQLNEARTGVFEPVMSILDAINQAQSDRLDSLDQFIQALLIFHNVDIDDESYKLLRRDGGIAYKDISDTLKGDIQYLTSQLDQSNTQNLVDNLYDMALKIVGLPQRSGGGGASTSDTGSAVVLRDGYYQAEVDAKSTELQFIMSERQFIDGCIRICNARAAVLDRLVATDVEIQFTRRNYENIQVKAQVLTTMLTCADSSGIRLIDPSIAFESCGMFSDPDRKAEISQHFYDAEKKKAEEKSEKYLEAVGNKQTDGGDGEGNGDDDNEANTQDKKEGGSGEGK